jgi:uncharacterized protein with PIN domain
MKLATQRSMEDVDRCPWCGHAVPHEKFEEIRKRVAAKERNVFRKLSAASKRPMT